MRVTVRQLQTFEAVARLGSVTRAAEEMHVSQPTVSKQMKQLQEEIGLPLLDQIGKKLFLTEAGQELYQTCSEWISTWGRLEQKMADLKGMKQGRLRIAAVTTTKYFMPRILGPFCQTYPGIDVSLEVLNRTRVLERLQQNEDDLYIMGVPPDDASVVAQAFLENQLVIIAPASHALAQQSKISLQTLAQEPFVLREQGSGTRLLIERLFRESGLNLNVRMELGSNEAIKQAVAGGLGISLISRSTLHGGPISSEIALLDVVDFPIKRHWYVLHHRDKKASVVTKTFIEYLFTHIDLLRPHT